MIFMRKWVLMISVVLVLSLITSGFVSGKSFNKYNKKEPDPKFTTTKIGDPYPYLTPGQLSAYNAGKQVFITKEGVADGLGPAFNGNSCGSCHGLGATGGSGLQFVTRVGKVTNGVFDPLEKEGGELLQAFGIGEFVSNINFTGEHVPEDANVVARRRTTALFGLGLIDATSDQTFINIARGEEKSTRGRVNMVFNISAGKLTVGKFGWKAQVPTLFQFAGDAYLNEMGITNPQFPKENPPQGDVAKLAIYDTVPDPEDNGTDVQKFTDFMQFLAPPPSDISVYNENGDKLFSQFGCDQCHLRSITSSPNPVSALSEKTYHPYSDFLLHDMGTLGDNIADQGIATGREMRTAPLWGLRFLNQNNLLHDGRAHSLREAIILHDGQAKAARDKFAKANLKRQQELLDFLNSL